MDQQGAAQGAEQAGQALQGKWLVQDVDAGERDERQPQGLPEGKGHAYGQARGGFGKGVVGKPDGYPHEDKAGEGSVGKAPAKGELHDRGTGHLKNDGRQQTEPVIGTCGIHDAPFRICGRTQRAPQRHCGAATDVPVRSGPAERASGLQMAAPVSLCHDGEEKPGEYEQRMLHLYMIGQK